jgi:preprotein translocase SecE subunit
VPTVKQATTTAKPNPVSNFVSETVSEMKKVTWLSRREVAYLTLLVLVVSIAAGVILGGIDFGFTQLIQKVFLGG